ncbi:NitT/TauT family transport system ATP-binding protein [Palleronia marisminoris]|uniref:Aliphatic sulfonates import ATP-binding protein SsuB n=2 Tax=Palleronia marisminoris TaxID=315423 RepID=A0A1Y5SGA3_9RHOB|nr:NitT/TauT family transport system ATP-binding protein [Palleronia marisminoris]SLN37035.1 Aliphatic sulfonates import ATP-binding protein SsuB [Palleronia marisminoris]
MRMERSLPTRDLTARIDRKEHIGADGDRLVVLDGLELRLAPGTFTCLIGPSGCGKTTTLRILMGLDDEFDGELDPALREARIATVFQEPRLLPWRTVAQNVLLALPRPDLPRVEAALASVGLEGMADRYPAQLSLGQARRVALARAFATEPEVLFLDEPFVSLDEASAGRLRDLLIALWQRRPMKVLMVTHNLREAVRLADRIVFLTERPARVAGVAEVELPRDGRDPEAVSRFAAELARRFPGLAVA